jgi:hypothetical protein
MVPTGTAKLIFNLINVYGLRYIVHLMGHTYNFETMPKTKKIPGLFSKRVTEGTLSPTAAADAMGLM